jgi:hypothetical protein
MTAAPYPFPPEFSLATADLPGLRAILDPLANDLAEYQAWVGQHGNTSLPTVEAMLNAVYDGERELRRWVDDHGEWMKEAACVDAGLCSLVEILDDAAGRIYDAIPNDPAIQDDRPGFIRLNPAMTPFAFEPVILAQIAWAAATVRQWLTTAPAVSAAAAKPDNRPPARSKARQGLILSTLLRHHGYDGISILRDEPLGVHELVAAADKKVSPATVSRWFNAKFSEGHKGYAAHCRNGRLLTDLKQLAGDFTPRALDIAAAEADATTRDDDGDE